MRGWMLAAALALAALAPSGSAAFARPADITISVDTSGAEAVLAAALADPAHAADAADAALENAPVRALLTKMAKYDKTVTPDSFKAAVIAFANGGSPDPFDFARLRTDPGPTRRMLARLKAENDVISRRVADRLRSFTPDGVELQARMIVLVGSKDENGWVPEHSPDFYIDLGFHGEEVDSVVNIASHELFHVVQGKVQPDQTPVFTDRPDLPPEARGQHRAHAVLLNLVLEGMATYVGDATIYPATGPHLLRDQHELKKELGRADQIFALFDTVLYRARQDPDAPLDALLAIGFGGSWDQTGYYVGYRMAQIIDRYAGRDRLRALVSLPPEDFVAEYITQARAHRGDPEVVPLAPSSVTTVDELARLGPQRP
jgi:hypothetical protein